jgi:hypothetical protein
MAPPNGWTYRENEQPFPDVEMSPTSAERGQGRVGL